MDPSWDAIWTSEVALTAEGWVVEMAIPYSMLRFPRAEAQTWGIQFSRHIPRLGEQSEWPLVPRVRRSNQVAGFGDLVGITGVAPRRNLQIQPQFSDRTFKHILVPVWVLLATGAEGGAATAPAVFPRLERDAAAVGAQVGEAAAAALALGRVRTGIRAETCLAPPSRKRLTSAPRDSAALGSRAPR